MPARPRRRGDGPGTAIGRARRHKFRHRLKSHAISAAFGAIVIGALIGGFGIAALCRRARRGARAAARTATRSPQCRRRLKRKSTATSRHSNDKIERAIAGTADRAHSPTVAAAEAQTKSLGDSLAALSRRVDDIAAAGQSAAKADADRSRRGKERRRRQRRSQRSDVDALTKPYRGARKRREIACPIKSRTRTSAADDHAARLTIAAEALRAAVERGAPYPAELAAVQVARRRPKRDGTAGAVRRRPACRAPRRWRTSSQALTPALQRAADHGAERNALSRPARRTTRKSSSRSRRSMRRPGDDPAAVIARIERRCRARRYRRGARRYRPIAGCGQTACRRLGQKAQARNAAIAASRQLAADALAALEQAGPQ